MYFNIVLYKCLPEPDTKKGTVKPEVDKKEPNGH